jgi:hypothetical protein
MSVALLALASLAAEAPSVVAPPSAPEARILDERERVEIEQTDNVRLSLPTQDDVEAWRSPGLRVQLGYGYAKLQGSGPAWSFASHSVSLRPSVRIDRYWALAVTMLYGTGPGGVRWSLTAEPTFFPWRQLALSVGLGYGGLSITDPNAPTGRLRGPDEVISRNLAGDEKLQSCTGSALSTVLRAEYLFVVGSLFSTGPFVQAEGQLTRCRATFGRTDPETGRSIVLTQWWRQQGATLGWWFAWR